MRVLNKLVTSWQDLMDNKSDQRTKDWFLMSSPFPTICISLFYVFAVKYIGPKFMANRKPFQLRRVIIAYNFIQILISFKLFYDTSTLGWLTTYSWRCEPYDNSPTGTPLKIARVCWYYYLSKFTELLDTVFFVLRKRFDQVSTLHVIHHGIMPVSIWWGVKFQPGGHATLVGFINSGVHVIMYTYYMLAAIGPQMQKYLWWKKYLTILQMTQFVILFVHSMQLYISNPCNCHIGYSWFIGVHALMFFFLFKAFYKQSYISQKVKDEKTEH